MVATLSAAFATPASATVEDGLYSTTHAPGYIYDFCTDFFAEMGYGAGAIYCALGVANQPGNIVYDFRRP
jgi:hypothetical protein